MFASTPLTIRAGSEALRVLRERGFERDAFSTLVGASGGPKWLVLRHLDAWLAEHFVAGRATPLSTLGSSIGSFRHACFARRDPLSTLARFHKSYVEQRYDGVPTPDQISRESERVLEEMLANGGADEIARNQDVRSHFVAARLLGADDDQGWAFKLRLGASALANGISRGTLGRFYERAVFGPSPHDIDFRDFGTRYRPLTAANVPGALLASGSIPLVMRSVRDIPGAPGLWFDGGIVDYHFDFSFRMPKGLVLFPHFFDRITPGWFDKPLRWRKPAGADLERVVMLAPSDDFVASLPGGKVPDRTDFETLPTEERIAQWYAITERCRALVDVWAEAVERGTVAELAQPFA